MPSQDGLVGRRRELDALRGRLEAARAGAGRLVLCAGEPGIGKTRLAQELAGIALAGGSTVAWGRCVEADGAPAFWPWRQVLRSLAVDADQLLAGRVNSPQDRFQRLDDVAEAVCAAGGSGGLVVILDDVHWADEPSLLVLRHLTHRIEAAPVLVMATLRDVEPASALPRVLPELTRSPAVDRIDLHRLALDEVRELMAGDVSDAEARSVLDVTGGNPLFVREVARARADGTWRPERPPRSVLDLVGARLDRVSDGCRRLLQAAAVTGRDFTLVVVADAIDEPVEACLPLVDEAGAYGLVDPLGGSGNYRFVHALTREAVEASLTTAERIRLHRAVAGALETRFAGDLAEHLADIARHWAALAPYGEAATARTWTVRAAGDAVRRLAYEEAIRLYRAALALPAPPLPPAEQCRVLVALGRAAYLAGDLQGCLDGAVAAAGAARSAGSSELMAEAALVLEATPDPGTNAIAKDLGEQALAGLGTDGHEALRARLLAQQSHLAFYEGDQDRTEPLSRTAIELARASGDDRALGDALRARQEACPGPAGRTERMALATEMLALAARTDSARTAMWGRLWRISALIEAGRLAAAAEELPALQVAVQRVGGPVSAWHLDRVTACVAQGQGRYAEASEVARRGFDRMRAVERAPATGAYFALQCALAAHVGVSADADVFVRQPFEPPPRFRTMGRVSRALLLTFAGRPDEATAAYQQAGPVESWSLPVFFVVPGYVYGLLAAAELGLHDDVRSLLAHLEPFRGEHAVGDAVAYMGPTELALGRGAAVVGRLDQAVDDLETAAEVAGRAGAPGFVAEARYHQALALLDRGNPGDRERAGAAAADADRLARALGMLAYVDRTGALVAQLGRGRPEALSRREVEVAELVAEGLTNRQIAERLVISERTAQNHVQHILTKLGFATRSQIATWRARTRR